MVILRWMMCAAVLIASLLTLPRPASADEVLTFPGLPASIDDFRADQVANNSPEGAAAMVVLAMLTFEQDAALGRALLAQCLIAARVVFAPTAPGGLTPNTDTEFYIDQFTRDPNIARSYVLGASPQNGYAVPETLSVALSRNRLSVVSPTEVRVFVDTSGQPQPRPVYTVKGDDGLWRVDDFTSLSVGVFKPSN